MKHSHLSSGNRGDTCHWQMAPYFQERFSTQGSETEATGDSGGMHPERRITLDSIRCQDTGVALLLRPSSASSCYQCGAFAYWAKFSNCQSVPLLVDAQASVGLWVFIP